MDVSDRYKKHGGINYFLNEFIIGIKTLADIAKQIGFSRETVRNDFINLMGKENYTKTIKERTLRKKPCKKKPFLNIADAIQLLNNKQLNSHASYAKNVISEINKKLNKTLTVKIFRNKIEAFYDEISISIRFAEVKNGTFDSRTNYYRFKITKSIKDYNYAIFVTLFDGEYLFYIFNVNEIKHYASLALNYRKPNKNMKHINALQNWDLIQSV